MTPHAKVDPARARPLPGRRAVKTINLALQGGGAHGAFTWGVLDRLLEEPSVAFEGVSATSAGAMNASVLAHGLAQGGREGARESLETFWRRVSDAGAYSPLQPSAWDRLTHNHGLESSPVYLFFDILTRVFSPYEFNPFNLNPLREALARTVDFERLRETSPIKLFLSATNVRTGKVKVFTERDLAVESVLASACLPFMFQAVEVEGEHYWDGGYMGNPAIFPLIYACESRDVVIVHINPIERADVPKTAREIMNRINEISFNSSLMREMRAIAFVTKLIDDGQVADKSLKRIFVHAIEAESYMRDLGVASKLNPDWEFLTHLRDLGRERASSWLDARHGALGVESTIDIRARYL
jgi:NTE family protein